MANEIRAFRETLARTLASARPRPEERSVEISPDGAFELELDHFLPEGIDLYSIVVASIRSARSGEVVASVRCEDDRCFHGWVSRDGRPYLLIPEALEGQTVVDLTTGEVAGFLSREDPFIWTEFHPSPDGASLTILGCYWACPYQAIVYDFREPLALPLPKLAECVLPADDASFGEWTSPDEFTIRDGRGGEWAFDLSRNEPTLRAIPRP